MPPAILLAIPPEYKALPARLDAWLNLSHLEKASVFVIERASAMAIVDHISVPLASFIFHLSLSITARLGKHNP